MKSKFIKIGTLAFSLTLTSCFLVPIDSTAPSVASSLPPSSSAKAKSSVLKPEDFPEYQECFGHEEPIVFWRDDNGEYYCGTYRQANTSFQEPMSLFIEMQNRACPAYVMKQIADAYYEKWPTMERYNYPIEIEYPFDDLAVGDLAFVYGSKTPSRDKTIYKLLDLENVYEKEYGDSEAVYFDSFGLFTDEDDPAFRVYPKYFTNLSYIYHWTDANGDSRFGVGPQPQDYEHVSYYRTIKFMQQGCSCSQSVMKRIIESYYQKTNSAAKNLIYDIPLFSDDDYGWGKELDLDHVSTDSTLYSELSLDASYRFHFGA